jgi:hypothetical protein
MIQVPMPSLQRLVGCARVALLAVLALWVVLAFTAVFTLSLGTDEAWVLNGLRSLLHPVVPQLSTELVVTSGGPFALINIGVEAWLGSSVWAHRMVSMAAMIGTYLLLLRYGRKAGTRPELRWLGLAVLISVPGLAEVGTAALGTAVGLFLMISSMVVWCSSSASAAARAVLGGLLFGLAAASRFDLVVFGPAVVLVASVRSDGPKGLRVGIDIPAIAFAGLGIAVFLVSLWIMSLAPVAMANGVVQNATGVSGWSLQYTKIVNQWVVLSGFIPPALIAILVLGGIWAARAKSVAEGNAKSGSFEALLVVTGLMLLAAWILRAPIPHLRYAIPGLFCLAAAGALALQRLAGGYLESGAGMRYLACQCLCLVCAIGSVASLSRSVALSDSDYLSWQWSHEMAHDYFQRFEAEADQRRVAAFIRDRMDADARLYSMLPYALRYMTSRPVVDILRLDSQASTSQVRYDKRYIVLTPMTGTYLYLRPESAIWIEQNTRLVMQFGRYSIYELDAGTDKDLLNIQVDRNIYRGHPQSHPWFGRG